MAKKFNKKWIDFGAIALGVAAIAMLFLTAFVAKENEEATITGFQAIFGYSETNDVPFVGEVTTHILDFSFLNLLGLIFVAGGIVVTVLNALGKSIPFASFIAAGLYIAGGVFFLMLLSFAVSHVETQGSLSVDMFDPEQWKLGIGAILGGVFAIVAGAAQLCKSLFLK